MMYKQKNMNSKKYLFKIIKIIGFITLFGFLQLGCNGKLPGGIHTVQRFLARSFSMSILQRKTQSFGLNF